MAVLRVSRVDTAAVAMAADTARMAATGGRKSRLMRMICLGDFRAGTA